MASFTAVVLAGFNAGIKVTIRADLYPTFQNMQQLAVQGDHWARLSVAYIKSLSSNHFKNDIFVQSNGCVVQGCEYTIVLPGCRVSVAENDKGDFFIFALQVDTNYAELQKKQLRSGLYRVQKNSSGEWTSEFVVDGRTNPDRNNSIVIADQHSNMQDAIARALDAISSSGFTSVHNLESNGFDLHFTPGKVRVGGLRNIQQAKHADTDFDLHESAFLLARAMKKSMHVQYVNWISEGGGSGVLTQAMRILRAQNIKFPDTRHAIFYASISTNLVKAETLARDIGLKAERSTHKKNSFSANEFIGSGIGGGYVAAYKRYRKDDKYTGLKFVTDIVKETSAHKGLLATFGIVGAAVAYTWGLSAGATVGPAVIALVAACLPKFFEVLADIAAAIFPRQVRKIKGKF